MKRGVFLDFASVNRGDLDPARLEQVATDWEFFPGTAPAQTADRIAGADVVVSNKVVIGAEHLAAASGLRLIAVSATGTNNIDLEVAKANGVAVTNVRGYGTASVAQHVFTLILALTTRLEAHRQAALDGTWANADLFCVLDYPFRELAGKTLGILGYGELGGGVARLGEAFGMEVVIGDRPGAEHRPGRLPLAELLARVDVLSLHLPLTPATEGLIGADQLALMKPDALLINTARGGIVDEPALAAALRAGRLGGAGFDVLTEEPPRRGNILLDRDIPNLIVTPHVAWAARESRQRVLDQVADCIAAFDRGESLNRVI